jgi:hypothetical protein
MPIARVAAATVLLYTTSMQLMSQESHGPHEPPNPPSLQQPMCVLHNRQNEPLAIIYILYSTVTFALTIALAFGHKMLLTQSVLLWPPPA